MLVSAPAVLKNADKVEECLAIGLLSLVLLSGLLYELK
jgi:hypothetical protein